MSDYDFEHMNEYRLINKRFAYAPRKRVAHNGHKNNFEEDTQILINGNFEGKPSDPEFSDLLKEYDSDSDDSEVCLTQAKYSLNFCYIVAVVKLDML